MPMPAQNATGRLTIAAINAAASARTSRSSGMTSVNVLPLAGDARITVIAASTPAIIHAAVDKRRTETPARRAESPFSDMARIASPWRGGGGKRAGAGTGGGGTDTRVEGG